MIGIRPGEKVHEQMISIDDSRRTADAGDFYVIQPDADWWEDDKWSAASPVPEGFSYTSDLNDRWLSVEDLRVLSDG
jgi:UDP-N-acetylglucosamine 4,6-dehydratase